MGENAYKAGCCLKGSRFTLAEIIEGKNSTRFSDGTNTVKLILLIFTRGQSEGEGQHF